ncbi:MAG: RNA polymerase sigma-70 factor, partial [uncultured Gemmatimonadaceae bacterium]
DLRGACRAAPVGVRHRLPDARQRERGGGRGAGGVPPPAPGARGGRAHPVAARLPLHGGLPAGARPAALGAGPARDLRGRVAARAARGERRRRSRAAGRACGVAVARLPRRAREPVARAACRVPAARGVRRAVRPDRGHRGDERAERPPARRTGAAPCGGAAPPVRGFARAAGGARLPLLRSRAGRRPPGPRGAAGPGCGAPRRRRRQGARARARGPRPRQGGPHARGVAARRRPGRRDLLAPRGGERPAGLRLPRPRRQADQRDGPRHRGRPGPGSQLDRQPGQAAAPGTRGRSGRPAGRAAL